ncbi:MAG: hypothetical protein AAF153_00190, partial [Pseudomonadota bacterium]
FKKLNGPGFNRNPIDVSNLKPYAEKFGVGYTRATNSETFYKVRPALVGWLREAPLAVIKHNEAIFGPNNMYETSLLNVPSKSRAEQALFERLAQFKATHQLVLVIVNPYLDSIKAHITQHNKSAREEFTTNTVQDLTRLAELWPKLLKIVDQAYIVSTPVIDIAGSLTLDQQQTLLNNLHTVFSQNDEEKLVHDTIMYRKFACQELKPDQVTPYARSPSR